MAAAKIEVNKYLKMLKENVKYLNVYECRSMKYKELNCKMISENLGVSVSTISNLNLDSKYSLIRAVAEEIYEAYYDYFCSTSEPLSDVVEALYRSSYIFD